MDSLFIFIFITLGLGLLIAGGELLTWAASRLSLSMGVAPIIVGLTVVAFGTSMPEAFVSFFASFEKKADIAISNVIGSNIFNIAFILGLAAMIRPLKVEAGSLRREIPFVIISSFLAFLFSLNGVISRIEGVCFLFLLFVFMAVCFRGIPRADASDVKRPTDSKLKMYVLILLALLVLVVGAKSLVSGAELFAQKMGVSELLIGLTVVAAGTSFPELATSLMASIRKKDDIAVGNVTGSNIFNILFILGISAIVSPLSVNDSVLYRDIPWMIGLSLITLPMIKSGFVISRFEGFCLVVGYVCYIIVLGKSL